MTGILLTLPVVVLWRLAWGALPMVRLPRRRAPFRLAPEWYGVPVARHRSDPDPGRDWVVA